MHPRQKEKVLHLLKEIMLCDAIDATEKKKVLDLILEYKGETDKLVDLLEKFLKAKNFVSLMGDRRVTSQE